MKEETATKKTTRKKETTKSPRDEERIINNYKISFDVIKSTYEGEVSRSERITNKFNFAMVLLGTLLVPLSFVWPSGDIEPVKKISVLLVILAIVILIAVGFVFCLCGIRPKTKYMSFDPSFYKEKEFKDLIHNNDEETVYNSYIERYSELAKKYQDENEFRGRHCTRVYNCLLLVTILYAIAFIIKLGIA